MFSIKRALHRYRGLPKEVYVLFFARVINSVGAFVFPLLTLILTDKIGMSKEQAGLCMTIIALSQVPFMFLGGKLADTFGRKKLIILFQILGASTYIVCGLVSPSMTSVYLIGLAANFYAMSYPALDSLAMDITCKDNRKEAYSVLYMGHNLGFAAGPVIGGLLFRNHLPLVFIGDALTTIVATVLMLVFIKETLPQKGERPKHTSSENALERHQTGSVLRILFIERPVLLFYALIIMIYEFSYNQWGFALPLQMNDIFGASGAQYFGFLASFNGILVIIFTPLVTSLTRKLHSLIAVGIGGLIYMVSFALFGIINQLTLFFVGMFIMTMGEIIGAVNGSTFVANHSPASHRGRISSVVNFISGSGRTFAPLIMGYIIAGTNMMISWFVIAGAVCFGAVMMFLLKKMKSKVGKQDEPVPGKPPDCSADTADSILVNSGE